MWAHPVYDYWNIIRYLIGYLYIVMISWVKAASGFIFCEDRNDMNMSQPAGKAGSGYIYEISKSMF